MSRKKSIKKLRSNAKDFEQKSSKLIGLGKVSSIGESSFHAAQIDQSRGIQSILAHQNSSYLSSQEEQNCEDTESEFEEEDLNGMERFLRERENM